MAAREEQADTLHQFIKTVHDSLIDPLKKNQVKISWQRELRDSKRFLDAENKIADVYGSYKVKREDFTLRDKVLEVLYTVHATRMTQFLETGTQIAVSECDALKEALAPYLDLLKPIDEIRRLQATMMNQGKLKKMPLPYDEITVSLSEIADLTAKMPKILMEGISSLSDALEKAA